LNAFIACWLQSCAAAAGVVALLAVGLLVFATFAFAETVLVVDQCAARSGAAVPLYGDGVGAIVEACAGLGVADQAVAAATDFGLVRSVRLEEQPSNIAAVSLGPLILCETFCKTPDENGQSQ
jgi:hypothetical protein